MENNIQGVMDLVNPVMAKKKDVGDCQLMTLSMGATQIVDVWNTGIPSLDIALGVGGIPKGRIIEIYGPESSGKTTLTLNVIGRIQGKGGTCGFIDAEHALDPVWAKKCGVDIDNLLFCQPDCGEDALCLAEEMIGQVDAIVIDSVSALVPRAEINGEIGDAHVGLQARLMGQALRKMVAKAKKKGTDIIFINQIRMKIGVMFGSPETTSGGNALKFYATVRLDIRRTGSGKQGEEIINNSIKIKDVKNKVAPPFKIATPVLDFEHGFDLPANLLPCLIDTGVIKKTGNTYKYEDGDVLGVGINQAVKGFREMFSAEDMNTLYENYLLDKLEPVEVKPKKKKKKKKKKEKKNGKGKNKKG